ncbi:MAG: lysyl-tRNA synthetase [Actinomycetota bacterium]|nr:lysyl-tRNA synthetase [Actinomycetota bacterium]
MWDAVFPYVAALLPTVAVATLFYFLIKTILEGDRRERLAQSKWEKEQREAAALPDNPENSQNPSE